MTSQPPTPTHGPSPSLHPATPPPPHPQLLSTLGGLQETGGATRRASPGAGAGASPGRWSPPFPGQPGCAMLIGGAGRRHDGRFALWRGCRYEAMMDYLCALVVRLEGSLKAEHGTGRNVAPYVEMEWGAKATSVMWEVRLPAVAERIESRLFTLTRLR